VKERDPETNSTQCPRCKVVSHHPLDIEYGYCGDCYRFYDDVGPDAGTDRPNDTFCQRCDIFGHAEGTVACEFYFERWATTDNG